MKLNKFALCSLTLALALGFTVGAFAQQTGTSPNIESLVPKVSGVEIHPYSRNGAQVIFKVAVEGGENCFLNSDFSLRVSEEGNAQSLQIVQAVKTNCQGGSKLRTFMVQTQQLDTKKSIYLDNPLAVGPLPIVLH
ncbi:MAG: hypothetical protein COT74_12695 [Bdellovibrionales bacterium CG10_big_fil_rev_8_21_14_0_10_45_34]|nr:MAG: hypothetical protein COT74_12695 [Bdellovibrionales bacterium CG10_big_fil_rev_8_21_14_0_10_45_34]